MSRPSPQTDRVVAVVEMLAGSPGGLNQSEIARRLGITPATCYPALAALERAGWLRRHPTRRTYALGPALIAAGQAAATGVDALEACRSRMVELQRRLGLSVLALVPAVDYASIAHIVADPRGPASALRVGDQIPFHPPLGATSTAWRSDAAVDRWLDRGGVTEPAARQQCRDILAFIRQRGYSVELATSLDDRVRRHLVDLVRARPDWDSGTPDSGTPDSGTRPRTAAPRTAAPRTAALRTAAPRTAAHRTAVRWARCCASSPMVSPPRPTW